MTQHGPSQGHDPTTAAPPGTPSWVKALGLLMIVAVLVVVVMMIALGGEHGPGRHM